MSVFDFNWGQVVWTILTVLLACGVVAGVALTISYFVRLNRRVEDLSRDVASLGEGRSEADNRDSGEAVGQDQIDQKPL